MALCLKISKLFFRNSSRTQIETLSFMQKRVSLIKHVPQCRDVTIVSQYISLLEHVAQMA